MSDEKKQAPVEQARDTDAPKVVIPWIPGVEREGEGFAGPPEPPNLARVTIRAEDPCFVWHPSGPDYRGTIFGYKFADGRIRGSLPGLVAMRLKAMGCRVERYEPGMDIADWNPQETGGFDPVFSFDPIYKAEEKAPEPAAEKPQPQPEEPAAQEPDPQPEKSPPVDYSKFTKAELKAECDKRNLKADRRSVVQMLEALEADDA